jgi:hypothetical protein
MHSWDVQFSKYILLSNVVTRLNSIICHNERCVVRCTQDTQYTAVLSCDQIIMEYTHDRYCNMPLMLSACNSRAGTAVWEYALRYPPSPSYW